MPLDVAMKEPLSRIVRIELDYQVLFRRNADRIFEWRVLQIQRGCLRLRIRTASYPTFSNIKNANFSHTVACFFLPICCYKHSSEEIIGSR
jgi:hypothetical protein